MRSYLRALPARFLWLLVLGVTLSISAYSLYFVARSGGVPKVFAAGMSVAFDGTALLLAEYSLRYAQAGMSATGLRIGVLVFAGLSAWLNSLHASLGHEPRTMIPMWAALPLAAVVAFEAHLRWERHRALARVGMAYPAPLPKFGGVTWFMFPLNAATSMRTIAGLRMAAVVKANTANATAKQPKPVSAPPANQPAITAKPPTKPEPDTVSEPKPPAEPVTSPGREGGNVVSLSRPSPKVVREWAKQHDIPVSDRARIAQDVWDAYTAANG